MGTGCISVYHIWNVFEHELGNTKWHLAQTKNKEISVKINIHLYLCYYAD